MTLQDKVRDLNNAISAGRVFNIYAAGRNDYRLLFITKSLDLVTCIWPDVKFTRTWAGCNTDIERLYAEYLSTTPPTTV